MERLGGQNISPMSVSPQARVATRLEHQERETMKTALRTLAGALVGLLAAFLILVAVKLLRGAVALCSGVVHPLPEGFGETMEEVCLHVERFPDWVLALAVPAWGLAAFAGAWTAQRIGNRWSFAIVGLLLLAALVLNISQLPYAIWFKVATLIVVPTAIVVGDRLSIGRKTAAAVAAG